MFTSFTGRFLSLGIKKLFISQGEKIAFQSLSNRVNVTLVSLPEVSYALNTNASPLSLSFIAVTIILSLSTEMKLFLGESTGMDVLYKCNWRVIQAFCYLHRICGLPISRMGVQYVCKSLFSLVYIDIILIGV